MSTIYAGVKLFVQQVTGMYFRKIHVVGVENMPMEGPTILCCNHANQFMDAMLVIAQCPRALSFCFAASSYNKPIVGYLAKKINVIPVYRPDDSKILGKGKINMISETEVLGEGTKFISDVKNNKNFKLGIHCLSIDKKYKLVVEKVIDETHIKVRSDPKIFEILQKEKNHNFFFIPKLDNSIMFRETTTKLHEGKAVCIFPEGTSHDQSHFLQIKAGVAYMALGAMADHGTKNIKLISCGLTYFNRDQFRSDLILEFGTPYNVPNEWGELFKINKKEAIERILQVVETQMKAVTLTAPTYKDYLSVVMSRNLYISNMDISPQNSNELAKRFSHVYENMKDDKDVKIIKKKIYKYMELLDNAGLEDVELQQINFNYTSFVIKTLISFILFHVYLLFSLAMITLTLPLVWFVRKLAEKERIKALEKNPNKFQAKDVVSSVKVTNFVKYLPLVGILWIILFGVFLNYYCYSFTHKKFSLLPIICVGTFLFLFYGYLSVLMVDKLFFYLETMKTRFIFFCFPKNIYRLKEMRKNLENEINDFVNFSISETEYENNRIIKLPEGQQNKAKRKGSGHSRATFKNNLKSFLNKF